MACDRGQKKAAQTAKANAISETSSQSGYVAGSTSQVSPFGPPGQAKPAGKRGISKTKKRPATTEAKVPAKKKPAATEQRTTTKRKSAARKRKAKEQSATTKPQQKQAVTKSQGKSAQTSFFEIQARANRGSEPLPAQRQIKISQVFTPDELQTISVQLRLGAAAVSRQIRELGSGANRGLGHSDPRPLDWAKLDQRNFQFLAGQVASARRGGGYIDTSSLKKEALFDLWEFSKFEADRAHRNIDHLFSGGSHLQGPTAEYLAERHKLDARFYTFLANQLEPMITPEMVEAYYVGL